MKKVLLVLCLPFIFISCSSMGTAVRTENLNALKTIQSIGIAPYVMYNLPNDISKSEFFTLLKICDETLLTSIKTNTHIDKILKVMSDSLYLNNYMNKRDSAIYEYAKIRHLDALLFCEITYRKTSYMFMPLVFAKTKLLCVKVNNNKTILDLDFDNRFTTDAGGSYEKATKESIDGAVKELLNYFNKSYKM